MELNKFFDHTCLKAEATLAEITNLCAEARQHGFYSVCVNPFYVPVAKILLQGSGVKVCAVVGFPLGQMTPAAKAFEAAEAVGAGADEIDMVQNVAMAKAHEYRYLQEEIQRVRAGMGGKVLKVILENCYLTPDEIVNSCLAAKAAGADFVKTSTGFGSGGAKVEDVKLMRETVGPAMGVKAAGGIHTKAQVLDMLAAGATRIGSSHSVAIVSEP